MKDKNRKAMWANMNKELSAIEAKQNDLDQQELDGKISSNVYKKRHDALNDLFTQVRWKKYGHLK